MWLLLYLGLVVARAEAASVRLVAVVWVLPGAVPPVSAVLAPALAAAFAVHPVPVAHVHSCSRVLSSLVLPSLASCSLDPSSCLSCCLSFLHDLSFAVCSSCLWSSSDLLQGCLERLARNLPYVACVAVQGCFPRGQLIANLRVPCSCVAGIAGSLQA